MTTETAETRPSTRSRGLAALVGAASAAGVAGGLISLAAALGSGSAAAYGALVGTGFVVGILALGSFAVHVVAGVMPAASLLFSLVTYTFQVVLMGLVFVGLNRSGALDHTLDREWLGGAIIAGALCWIAAQIVVATRARIPAYDLPASTPEASAR